MPGRARGGLQLLLHNMSGSHRVWGGPTSLEDAADLKKSGGFLRGECEGRNEGLEGGR